MSLGAPSWSSLHMSKTPRHAQPPSTPLKTKHHHMPPPSQLMRQPSASSSNMSFGGDSLQLSASRSSSLAGKKRPRESEGESTKPRISRRTKSVGDQRDVRTKSRDRDREAFQRGLIAVFVPNALRESLVGKMEHYNDLLAHFLPTVTSPIPALQPLQPLLKALTANVTMLSPDIHAPLVSAVLALKWAAGEDRFVKIFIGFCGVLVSAQPGFAKEVVNMAVKGLTWQHIIPSTSSTPITRRLYHARHHLLLSHLLSLMPMLPSVIQPVLAKNFPNKREQEVAQTTWVRNCCEMTGYCPELGQRVWSQIVDRMLRIDVEITKAVEAEEDDEETEDEYDQEQTASLPSIDPFDLSISEDMPVPEDSAIDNSDSDDDVDPDDLSSVDGEGEGDEDEKDLVDEAAILAAKVKRKEAVKVMKGKLDGMLVYFFQHLQECMGGRPTPMPAAEMAAGHLASTANSSGASTPTAEQPNPLSSSIPTPTITTNRPTPTPAQSLSHFQTLLTLFSRQILPTSATQHVPFVLFITSSLSPSHSDLFLGLLVSQALYATSTTMPTAASQPLSMSQRVASAVYIGSIVCRARFVTDEQARQVLTYLLAYIDGKSSQAQQSGSNGRIKLDESQLFYAVCQSVLLIFCFRWRAFTEDKDRDNVLGEMEMDGESQEGESDGKWMKDLDVLQRVIFSDLNPLLGCNPTVVATFAKVAHQTNFAYCFSLIEANQQSQNTSRPAVSRTSTSTSTFSRTSSHSHLATCTSMTLPKSARQSNVDAGYDDYFPFDPYYLPRSKRFIDPLFITYDDVAIEADDDDSDASDSEIADMQDEDEENDEDDSIDSGSMDLPGRMKNGAKHPGGMNISKIKSTSSSYTDRRKRLFERDNGLSSSLEGMSISPGIPRMIGR